VHDAERALYGLVCCLHLGIGGQKKGMTVLMNLNQNGQAVTLSLVVQREHVPEVDGPSAAGRADRIGIVMQTLSQPGSPAGPDRR
jgi:hypothetical protein